MNIKLGEYNGRAAVMVNGRAQKFCGFQALNFGKTFVVLVQIPPLVFGGQGCGIRKRQKMYKWK